MKGLFFKCDWCGTDRMVQDGQPEGWCERKGTKPVLKKDNVKNTKWHEQDNEQDLQFCGDRCNQKAKGAEAAATAAAHKAWVRTYNEHKG